SAWKNSGLVNVLFLGVVQNISPSYYEAANMAGASKLRQLVSITIPLLSPTTFCVTIITLIVSLQVVEQVMIMAEGGPSGATMT
ncbi:carbohydrate ABC transporter permease, partial [Listeria monocytogenes]|uniref:carbohydrate ABC transporter permease n=1 Tax=Listeria monocytogenes TaxID=1639 RepID=UPI0013C4D8C2